MRTRNRVPIADTRNIHREGETGPNGTVRHGGIFKGADAPEGIPLKQQLTSAKEFSTREGSRPLGDEYADIKQMIDSSISAAVPTGPAVTAGTGLTLTGTTLSVNNDLANVVTLGTLGALTVTGPTTLGDVNVTGSLRSAKAIVTPMQYFAPVEGDTVTASALSNGVVLNPAAALAALTIQFPATPLNGQYFAVYSSQDVAAVTVAAPFANGNGPTAGITAGTPLKFVWNSDASKWFKN